MSLFFFQKINMVMIYIKLLLLIMYRRCLYKKKIHLKKNVQNIRMSFNTSHILELIKLEGREIYLFHIY